jgi:ribosomal protein L11 methylase PrmA
MAEDHDLDEVVDDWNLPMEFHLFAKHETHVLHLNTPVVAKHCHNHRNLDREDGATLELECVESLTPLDMIGLSSGAHDATGHCVWTGAFLLIATLDAPTTDYTNDESSGSVTLPSSILSLVFKSKCVIELGSGTGIGGIALSKSHSCRPKRIFFTDADPDVLALCQRNCKRNLSPGAESDQVGPENVLKWRTVKLTWGQDPLPSEIKPSSFDAVLATDVLYDIGLLPALLRTASACLVRGGHFCLSHVPRACFNSENQPVDDLEGHIVDQAERHGFKLAATIRPRDCQQSTRIPPSALNYIKMCDLDQVGAAILVFALIDE